VRRPVDQWFRLGLRGGIENQAYAKAMTANAAMTPITIKKSRTGAFPFEEQGEYKQGYPKSYKDQAIAERMWSVRTQGDIERCQGHKEWRPPEASLRSARLPSLRSSRWPSFSGSGSLKDSCRTDCRSFPSVACVRIEEGQLGRGAGDAASATHRRLRPGQSIVQSSIGAPLVGV